MNFFSRFSIFYGRYGFKVQPTRRSPQETKISRLVGVAVPEAREHISRAWHIIVCARYQKRLDDAQAVCVLFKLDTI